MGEIGIEYMDEGQHLISISGDDTYASITLTKNSVNKLIQTLIKYTQENPEWRKD